MMALRLFIVAMLIALLAFAATAELGGSVSSGDPNAALLGRPTDEQIREWWFQGRSRTYSEPMEILHTFPVVFEGGENAFLCNVWFDDRGRNFQRGVLLVRPGLKQAHEILGTNSEIEDVRYLPRRSRRNTPSMIVHSGVGSGQGETEGIRQIFLINRRGTPVILHEQRFEDNWGNCGGDTLRLCHSKEVKWEFVPNMGGSEGLRETLVFCDGKESEQLKCKTEVRTYLYKDKKFVPVDPHIVNSSPNSSGK
jgi:hypothetical protein